MIPVYDAANLLDAQLVHDLLRGAGLQPRVFGAELMGAVGELPAEGLVRVWVADRHAAAARGLIADWQASEVPDEDELARLADSQAAEGDFWA